VAAGQPLAVVDPEVVTGGAQTPRTGNPMPIMRVDDLLAVQGVKPETVEALRPFVIVLPSDDTTVNVNTAPAEVLAAVLPGCSLAQANALVEQRKRIPWNDLQQFKSELQCEQAQQPQGEAKINITSNYFLVQSRIRLDRAALDAESLVERGGNLVNRGSINVIWTRQN